MATTPLFCHYLWFFNSKMREKIRFGVKQTITEFTKNVNFIVYKKTSNQICEE